MKHRALLVTRMFERSCEKMFASNNFHVHNHLYLFQCHGHKSNTTDEMNGRGESVREEQK